MRTYNRKFNFDSFDFKRMCKFIIKENSIRKEYFIWHIARLIDWKYNLYNPMKFFPSNFEDYTHLWFNFYDELAGFVISEDFNNSFFVFVKPSSHYLFPEMVNWYKEQFGNKYKTLITEAVEDEFQYMSVLENMGFVRSSQLEKTRVFDTAAFKDFTIQVKNIKLQNMVENNNFDEQALLRLNAWSRKIDPDLDRQIRNYCRRSPIYNPRFDFVLVDNNGKQIAGCEAFIDHENNTGEIERVCTHSDYYNRGHSQNILKASMRKLYENNIKTAFITGGYDKTIHLYGKLGHKKEVSRYFYELKME